MKLKGSCHCGSTRFEVDHAPESVTACNCSICSKLGGLWAYYSPDEIKFDAKPEPLSTYQWGDKMVSFHFCGVCGCKTFSEMPSWIDGEIDFSKPRICVNARLFDDFDLSAVPVTHIDGKNFQ